MNFKKYKYIYLIIILVLLSAISILSTPLHEAYVDINIRPPESIRKVDFSWISVNQWFSGQIQLIKSHYILKKVTSKISTDKLAKMIFVKRLGNTDTIRIAARANRPEGLKEIVDNTGSVYLKNLNELDEEAYQANVIKHCGHIHDEHIKIEEQISRVNEQLRKYEVEMKDLEAEEEPLKRIKTDIVDIDKGLSELKQKLSSLRSIYTDSYPEVIKTKNELELLEKTEEEINRELAAMQKVEHEKVDIASKIHYNKKKLANFEKQLDALNNCADEIRKGTALNKGVFGYIINPPALKFMPDLPIKLLLSSSAALLIWFLALLVFRKK